MISVSGLLLGVAGGVLAPRAPWFGYELGDWTEQDREEAQWAVDGEYLRSGDRAKQQRRPPPKLDQ